MSPILRYLPRLAADYLFTRGGVMLVVGLALMLPVLAAMRLVPPGAESEFMRQGALGGFLQNIAPLLALVGAAGVIAGDLRHGYYRFLFTRPIAPAAYYGTAFGVVLAGIAVVLLALTGLFGLIGEPTWPWAILAGVMVQATLVAALVFAFSRFTRLDWLFALFVLMLAAPVRARFPRDGSLLGQVLNVLLPPDLPAVLFPATGPLWGDVASGLAYAGVAVAAGLAAVRFVPLGSGR